MDKLVLNVSRDKKSSSYYFAIISAALLTGFILTMVQLKVERPMLLLERFFKGMGWVEIALLCLYSMFITAQMLDMNQSAKWRSRIWRLFSIVFFSQLFIGLAGLDQFLMTGQLHLPIPALIVAGPIFRGEGFFMPILFLSTIVLVGPAWCSHLCYIGGLDDASAKSNKKISQIPNSAKWIRLTIFIVVILIATVLRYFSVGTDVAFWFALCFGVLGLLIMLMLSRKKGVMLHCVSYCPIGLIANTAGKLNPFRIKISDGCTECGICSRNCRYNALTMLDIKKRRAGFSCSLCGDCVGSCKHRQINYSFAYLQPETARMLFIIIVVAIQASFLGLARI